MNVSSPVARQRRVIRRRWTISRMISGALGAAIVATLAILYGRALFTPPSEIDGEPLVAGAARVLYVIDGDTLQIEQQQPTGVVRRRVRLIGIDTPELGRTDAPLKAATADQPFAREAAELLRQLTAEREVRLELDRRRRDRYGRSLAYLYVDKRLVQEELLRRGLAVVDAFPGDSASMAKRLEIAEQDARKHQRGQWQKQ